MMTVRGTVIHGKQLGRTIGYPTANIAVSSWPAISGVYAALTKVDGRQYPVMLNVGKHPTFPEGEATIEAHLIGFVGNLYGRELTVNIIEFLRDERKFTSMETLKEQLKQDCADTLTAVCKHGYNCSGRGTDMLKKTNYHTHTPRCKHASGTEKEYCEKAIENGFAVLGFTDHCAWPYENGFVSTFHMDVDQLEDYAASVNRVRNEFAGRLEVHLGLECEYYPAYINWMAEKKEELRLEYLILGNHFDTTDNGGMYFGRCMEPGHLKRYVKMCIEGLETGLFSYFAHPDLFLRSYSGFDENCRMASLDLCQAAKSLRIPVEYNLLGFINCKNREDGMLGYPCTQFWEVAAEVGVDAMIGVDAHSPGRFDEQDSWNKAETFLKNLGINRLERMRI